MPKNMREKHVSNMCRKLFIVTKFYLNILNGKLYSLHGSTCFNSLTRLKYQLLFFFLTMVTQRFEFITYSNSLLLGHS